MNKMIIVESRISKKVFKKHPDQARIIIENDIARGAASFAVKKFDDHFQKKDFFEEGEFVVTCGGAYIIRPDKIKNVQRTLERTFINVDGKQVSIAEYLEII